VNQICYGIRDENVNCSSNQLSNELLVGRVIPILYQNSFLLVIWVWHQSSN